MKLTLPPQAVEHLTARGLQGNPEDWPFRVVSLSGNRVYLWFHTNDGFTVCHNEWEMENMAQAASSDDDAAALSATRLALTVLQGHSKPVLVFPDGSLAWDIKSTRHVACWRSNEAANQIGAWAEQLASKSTNWWIKLTRRAAPFKKISDTLRTLEGKMKMTN